MLKIHNLFYQGLLILKFNYSNLFEQDSLSIIHYHHPQKSHPLKHHHSIQCFRYYYAFMPFTNPIDLEFLFDRLIDLKISLLLHLSIIRSYQI